MRRYTFVQVHGVHDVRRPGLSEIMLNRVQKQTFSIYVSHLIFITVIAVARLMIREYRSTIK